MNRRLERVALAALAFAFVFLIQPAGDNEKAHLALVRALADGTPYVDEHVRAAETRTVDVTRFEDHVYAAKAPGTALFALPVYALVEAFGGISDLAILLWVLHLWASALPALVLLVVVRAVADRFEPGLGIASAVALGAATLLLPFATLFFSHVLAAALVFGAFALLVLAPQPGAVRLGVAGLLAGVAVTVEYPAGLAGAAIFLYALARNRSASALAAYVAGSLAGAAPALAFNQWAFGSPLRFPYEGWAPDDASQSLPGIFGLTLPDPHVLLALVFAPAGLGSLAFGSVGALLLVRRGLRAEGVLLLALPVAYLLYNASFVEPFGGASPGPRYLVTTLPFLCAALAPALPRYGGAALGLAFATGAFLAAATVTSPLAAWDSEVLHRLRTGGYVRSLLEPLGTDGALGVVPFAAGLLVAAAVGAVAVRPSLRREDALAFALAAGGWAVLASQSRRLLDDEPSYATDAAFLAAAAVLAAGLVAAYRDRDGLRA